MSKPTRPETPWWRWLLGERGGGPARGNDGAARLEQSAPGNGGSSAADERQLADIGYEPGVNQVRHEPMPASKNADQRQEAVVRNEQLGVPGHGREADPLYPPRHSSDDNAG